MLKIKKPWVASMVFIFFVMTGVAGLRSAVAEVCDESKFASINKNAIFWRLEKKGHSPSYLLGTLHVSGPWVEIRVEEMAELFDQTYALVMELEASKTVQLRMAHNTLLPSNYRLRDFFTVQEYDFIVDIMRHRFSVQTLSVVKPWVVFAQMYLPKVKADRTMDVLIAKEYQSLGKAVLGLESVDRQLAVFDALTLEEQASLVKKALPLYEKQINTFTEQLFESYRRGDLMSLWRMHEVLTRQMGQEFLTLQDETLAKRNIDMAKHLSAILDGRSYLIAIGALHLAGPYGMICLLEDQGYQFLPMEIPVRAKQ